MDGTLGNNGPLQGFPWRKLVWGTAITLMLAATVAKFTVAGFNWSPGDFVFAAVLIGGGALAFELAMWVARGSTPYLLGAAMGIGACFLLVWINAAVGIIGDEDNAANLGFLAIVVVAMLGTLAARARAAGMARVTTLCGVGQLGMAGYAFWVSSIEGIVASVVFAGIWFTAAHLFRVAAREQAA